MTESWKVLEKGFKRSGVESGDASLPDSCFFMLRMGDDWGFAPSPSREQCSLHPFFASRRFKVAGMGIR